ncbi:unnamed protein product [Clavelina lepadiformis]|uniref:Sulfotransferase family protein n=1 Tax=Clavelina lepadiformis TaxID=159417 RepID=A0ABP0G8P8_CLALP
MKVICAGYSKTGTKSMQAALTELGYNVYDYMENFAYLYDDWMKILKEGGTTEDFRRMFENVDAVTDLPCYYFWDEIHKAFPEAKIILTTRDNEDIWATSLRNQFKAQETSILSLIWLFSPTLMRLHKFGKHVIMTGLGINMEVNFFGPRLLNIDLARMKYRRHNAHVLQEAPKDKLLVFNVKEGWEPLCTFLGVEVPSKPFPKRNVNADIMNELREKDPSLKRARRELAVITSLFLLSCAGIGLTFARKSPFYFWHEKLICLPKLFWG